ncbi:thioredoxin family protein [Longirhabdus pacifica]|uniref:thioredoxin family protein n=1 Tax=Longirhabdus pacifica TaxID=2305227 RepID=UPI0010091D6E|nr:thioredoxin family protein [Longirhabdus pacifica]
MNKWLWIGIIFVVAILFTTTDIFQQDTGQDKETDARSLYQDISMEQYQEKINNKESFVIYVYSPECSHCQEFKPTLNTAIEDNEIEIIALNTNVEENKDEAFFQQIQLQSIPALLHYENGVEFNRAVGTLTEEQLYAFLQDANVITAQ